ncbi:hypothetical protein [Herbaspirillum sp. RTI4]|uniref:hypothetical protein n=1 Tax=Herbaspirillum sp. RTI4 TaxID=3048640 RepID=UPI003A5993DB
MPAEDLRELRRRSAVNRFLISRHSLPEMGDIGFLDTPYARLLVDGWYYLPEAAHLIGCWLYRDNIVRQGFYCSLNKHTRRFLCLPFPSKRIAISNDSIDADFLFQTGCHYLLQLRDFVPKSFGSRLALVLDAPPDYGSTPIHIPQPDKSLITFAISHAKTYSISVSSSKD